MPLSGQLQAQENSGVSRSYHLQISVQKGQPGPHQATERTSNCAKPPGPHLECSTQSWILQKAKARSRGRQDSWHCQEEKSLPQDNNVYRSDVALERGRLTFRRKLGIFMNSQWYRKEGNHLFITSLNLPTAGHSCQPGVGSLGTQIRQ